MKSILKYSLISIAFAFITGCSQNDVLEDDNATYPEYGYIFFDTELGNGTKGTLINPNGPDDIPLEADFGVIGYTYVANEWTTAEVQATPNVFSINPLIDHWPLRVTWNSSNNMHTYTNSASEPYVAWIGKQKYAFFAYYPYNNNYVKPSPYNKEGNPYLEFQLPGRGSVNSPADVSTHVDVLTAHVIDTDYSTRSVSFRMQHRLTAIDIIANNLYTNGETVNINDISITLNNLVYDKVRIPLNSRDVRELDYYAGVVEDEDDRKAYYKLLSGKSINVGLNTEITAVEGTTMIVIPQDQKIDTTPDNNNDDKQDFTITGKVKVKYTVKGTEYTLSPDFKINRDLLAGHRYYILLNFSDGDINIVVIESDVWSEREIKYEFE